MYSISSIDSTQQNCNKPRVRSIASQSAPVLSKNQRRVLLPRGASYRGLSNCWKMQFLAKLTECVMHNSSQYEVKCAAVLQSTHTDSSHIFIIIGQTYAGLLQVTITIEHCNCNLYSGLLQMQLQKSQEQYQKTQNLWWCSIKSECHDMC